MRYELVSPKQYLSKKPLLLPYQVRISLKETETKTQQEAGRQPPPEHLPPRQTPANNPEVYAPVGYGVLFCVCTDFISYVIFSAAKPVTCPMVFETVLGFVLIYHSGIYSYR
jgi:hypothetical protein